MPPSIIVTPVLNGARFIEEAMTSIARQTDGEWVHYVVDGGSTDGTQDIVRATMEGEPRRRLIEGRDKGLYDAVFRGFDCARADGFGDPATICLWLNSDDLLMPWALATLRAAFARTAADWITSLPCYWDSQGRMTCLLPYGWYPRPLIRAGLFQANALGCIQQESSFFTTGLLDRLPAETVAAIRTMRLAGDFHLWRAFADLTAAVPLALPVSGFRKHGGNASLTRRGDYSAEIAGMGVPIPGPRLGRILRILFRPFTLLKFALAVRKQARWIDPQDGSPES